MEKDPNSKTIVITGSNKGLGFGILRILAQKDPHKYQFIMAVRSVERGQQAVKELAKELEGIDAQIDVHELDITKTSSIDAFVEWINEKYRFIDCLFNNAGVMIKTDKFNIDVVEETFATNVNGTIDLTEKMIPYVKEDGKIIFMGSRLGLLSFLQSQSLQDQFLSNELSIDGLQKMVTDFKEAVKEGDYAKYGWIEKPYYVSKMFINTYARLLAKTKEMLSQNIQVYAASPGYVKTDMTSNDADRTIEEGADTPVWLVELPWELKMDYQGQLIHDREVLSPLSAYKSKL